MHSPINSTPKVCRVHYSLKIGIACGPDGMSQRFLQEFADELVPVLFASSSNPALTLLLGSLFLRRVTNLILLPTILLLKLLLR